MSPIIGTTSAADMSTAKAHRYLVGSWRRDCSGSYDLGPLAVRVGLAALERFDVVRVAGERLQALRDLVDQTVMLSVWTDAGPTVARIDLSRHPVTLAVRVGTSYPLLTSATGMIFLAFAPERIDEARIAEEIAASRQAHVLGAAQSMQEVDRLRQLVCEHQTAALDQLFLVGVSAVSAPLFDGEHKLAAALTAIGRPGSIDLAPDGVIATALRSFARDVSTGGRSA